MSRKPTPETPALAAAREAYREANRAVQARQRMVNQHPDRGIYDTELASLRALRQEAAATFHRLVAEARGA